MGTFNDSLRAMLHFERPQPLCHFEWGYWPETLARWRQEGMPAGEPSHGEPWDAVGITYYHRVPVEARIFPHFESKVLSETANTKIIQDWQGVVMEVRKDGVTAFPHFLRHPVRDMDDFEALRGRLDPHTPGRFPSDWAERARRLADRNSVLVMGGCEISFFGWHRDLMGLENLMMAYYDQPELIHAISRQHLDFIKEIYARVLKDVTFDFIFCWEDMSYKNGPLISPALVREFMLPYYAELVDFFRQFGEYKFLLDSDGDVTQLIPLFMEVGIDGMLPFEVAAGMDVVRIAEQYPRFILSGGIDKREIAKGRRAIDRELERVLPPLFRRGGYLPGMDHHVPPEVSYEDFRYYVRRVHELYEQHGAG